jgi:hypothetical protein
VSPAVHQVTAVPAVHRAIIAYEALRQANDLADVATCQEETGTAMNRAVWQASVEAAVYALNRPPESETDLMLQVGLAASFVGIVADQTEENTVARSLALAIASLLENATLYLAERVTCPVKLADARDHYVAQAKLVGAESKA